MKEYFEKALAWIKSNIPLAIIGGLLLLVLLFPRILRKLLGTQRTRSRRRSLPRSVGTRRRIKRHYSKTGKRLKAWQIKGSAAARRHMAQIRKRRA